MALIKCFECGREISDKAVSCPGCGCPVTSKSDVGTLNVVFKDMKGRSIEIKNGFLNILNKNGSVICSDYLKNYILLYTKPGTAFTHAMIIVAHNNIKKSICLYIHQADGNSFNQLTGILRKNCLEENCTFDEAVGYKANMGLEKQRELKYYRKAQRQMAFSTLTDQTARCPRCHSTSISYDTKKLSIGRAIVGDAIAGAPGAVLGGLSSKKGYGVCLNCGKRWKI